MKKRTVHERHMEIQHIHSTEHGIRSPWLAVQSDLETPCGETRMRVECGETGGDLTNPGLTRAHLDSTTNLTPILVPFKRSLTMATYIGKSKVKIQTKRTEALLGV